MVNFKKIKKAVDPEKIFKDVLGMDLGQMIKKVIDGVIDDLMGVVEDIFTKPFKQFGKMLQNSMKSFFKVIKSVFQKLLIPIQWIAKSVSIFGKIIKTTFKNFANIMKTAFKGMMKFFTMLGRIIGKAFGKFGKIMMGVFKMFAKYFMIMIKFLQKMLLTIGAFFAALFEQLAKSFGEFFFYILCGWNKIIAFPTCALYYLLDIMIFVILLPFRFLFWIVPPLRPLEDVVWELVDLFDTMVYSFTAQVFGVGIHINQWPNDVLNRCYRCKPEKEDFDRDALYRQFEQLFENGKGSFFGFASQFFIFMLCAVTIGIYIYRWLTPKTCDVSDGPS
jgi:hypothetical protein